MEGTGATWSTALGVCNWIIQSPLDADACGCVQPLPGMRSKEAISLVVQHRVIEACQASCSASNQGSAVLLCSAPGLSLETFTGNIHAYGLEDMA